MVVLETKVSSWIPAVTSVSFNSNLSILIIAIETKISSWFPLVVLISNKKIAMPNGIKFLFFHILAKNANPIVKIFSSILHFSCLVSNQVEK